MASATAGPSARPLDPSSAAYPEFDQIPPTSRPRDSPTSSSSQSYLPSPILRFFALSPLVTFPAAATPTESHVTTTTEPVLYVAPGHPRAGTQGSASSSTWTSADVRCLRWQMELLLRGQGQTRTQQIEPGEAWGPIQGGLPFLELPAPSSRRRTSANAHASGSSSSAPRVLGGHDSLRTWCETNAPFEYQRKELGQASEQAKTARPYPNEATQDEAEMWMTLLEQGLMAAVLLAQMTASIAAENSQSMSGTHSRPSAPLFSRLLRDHLASQRSAKEAWQIQNLASSAANTPASLSRWTSYIPSTGLNLSWMGLGSTLPEGEGAQSNDGEGADERGYTSWPEDLDLDAVIEEGVKAIQAADKGLFKDHDRGDVKSNETHEASTRWCVGAR